MQVHIGNLIRDELRRQGHTNAWLASEIGMSERNVQRIFQNPSIDTQRLMLISKVLSTDFFAYYSKVLQE